MAVFKCPRGFVGRCAACTAGCIVAGLERKHDYARIAQQLFLEEWLNMQCGFTSKEAAYAFLYGASLRKISEAFRV